MKHISLFSGIGGFDLASDRMGWTNVASCEIGEFGRRVLAHYWPNAYHHNDIHTLTIQKLNYEITERHGENWRSDDIILTGGFPCQPYSAAGKRLGKDDERHLWPEMLRVVREVQPKWIVGENVFGLVNWSGGLVFEEVQADLEAEGYEVQPFILPAASTNAPHRRDRVWFVAYSDKCNDGRITREDESESGEERVQERNEVRQSVESSEVQRNATNSNKCTTKSSRKSRKTQSEWSKNNDEQSCWRGEAEQYIGCGDVLRNATNTDSANNKAQPQKRVLGQADKRRKAGRFVNGYTWTQWDDFPTQSPICGGDDGLPTKLDGITFSKWRNESIKAYGNAVVPQVVLQIFKAIQQYENLTK